MDALGEDVSVTGNKLDVNATVSITGGATESNQTDGSQKTQIVDAGGEAVTITGGKLDVNASIDTTGLALDATLGSPAQAGEAASATASLALEAGGNLAAIKAKTDNIPALGQALAAASVPVILPAATITTLTPPAAITGFATSALQLPDGHNVTVDNAAGAAAVNIQDGGNTITVDGTITANLSATDNAVLDDIALNQTDASQKTQIVDGAGNVIGATSNALDVNIKSGASAGEQYTDNTVVNAAYKGTIALGTDGSNYQILKTDADGNVQVDIVSGATAGTEYADGAVRGTATGGLMMGDDGTNIQSVHTDSSGDLQVDVLSSALPTGAATEATLGDVKTAVQLIDNAISGAGFNITQLGGAAVPIGAGTEVAALRVTLATDSTGVVSIDDNGGAITVDGSVTANAGTNLNTSALALEAGGNLAAIKAKTDNIPALGQALAASSVPVILPSATITTLTPPAAITGFATEATLGTVHGHVDSIDTKTPSLGQALAAASVPVILPAATITTLTPPAAITGFALETGGNLAAAATSLGNLDNSVDGNYLNVNQNIAGTDVAAGAGTVNAQTQRVTHASDDPVNTAVQSKYITGIGHGVATVTTAGTDVAIAASTPCKKVTLQAQTDNTSLIAVGASGVDATVATGTGIILYAGDSYEFDIDNLADIYIDSLVNGEGVRYCYFT